eukprot:TRINITY_DN27106_c0_g1_i1.p1 TRINITY_DN27106_c0_g1~~TRINITY_DN27106_c0_g1_i1.p1  ORF type:complete len:119 (-),score=22.92 TRINITY_DN27106_c0_g1_i1:25-381(-)
MCIRDRDVGEQYRGIHAKAADWLQRHFLSQIRAIAEVQKITGLRPRGTIFRQVPPRLAHEPERWPIHGLALQRRQKPLRYLLRCHCLPRWLDVVRCICLLYTSPSPRDRTRSRMPSSA